MIETSICIEKARQHKLLSAANQMGISVSDLLVLLIDKSRLLFDNKPELFHTVSYQHLGNDESVIMHISVPDITYEYAVSQRYIFKISVSFIVRKSIDFFLSDIITDFISSYRKSGQFPSDNYVSTNYIKSQKIKSAFSIDYHETRHSEHWRINRNKAEE